MKVRSAKGRPGNNKTDDGIYNTNKQRINEFVVVALAWLSTHGMLANAIAEVAVAATG